MSAITTEPRDDTPPENVRAGVAERGVWRTLSVAAADIKLAHSVFALPFAVLGAFLARPNGTGNGHGRFAGQLGLIVVCMVCARTWAMLINRIADRRLDAANARTARRAVASGRLRLRDALVMACASAALFVCACGAFWWLFENRWPLLLSVPVLGWLAFYSFTKRFTLVCHLVLGAALAISPVAAALAVNPDYVRVMPTVWWLAGMVLLWVAGFDVIYALQDIEFDLRHRLHSIPSHVGWRGAIWISRVLHAGCFAMLVMAARSDARFGGVFWGGVAAVGALLVIEHVVLARRGRAGLEMAFFTVNGVVSCVLGLAGVLDVTLA